MEENTLSQRRCLSFLLQLQVECLKALVVTVARLNGTPIDRGQGNCKAPCHPQDSPVAGILQTPEPAVLRGRCLAWLGRGQTYCKPIKAGASSTLTKSPVGKRMAASFPSAWENLGVSSRVPTVMTGVLECTAQGGYQEGRKGCQFLVRIPK